jgi:hypothetical protein
MVHEKAAMAAAKASATEMTELDARVSKAIDGWKNITGKKCSVAQLTG